MLHTVLQLVLAVSLVSFQQGGPTLWSFETMRLNLHSVLESPRGLIKRQLTRPYPKISDSEGLRWGLESGIWECVFLTGSLVGLLLLLLMMMVQGLRVKNPCPRECVENADSWALPQSLNPGDVSGPWNFHFNNKHPLGLLTLQEKHWLRGKSWSWKRYQEAWEQLRVKEPQTGQT